MAIDDAITLKKLEVFLAFMALNNMARVAEALGQSTVSVHRALHSLEEALRCPLFKREGRNMIPLQTAYTFAEYAKKSIDECEEGVRKVREAAGFNATRLKIGSLYSLTLRCIPQLLVGLKSRRPELDIDLTLGSNQELLRSLADGQLDAIVIGLHAENDSNGLVSVPLFDDDVFLAAPLRSPYAGKSHIDLQDFRTEKFVTLTEGYATSDNFKYCFEQAGFSSQYCDAGERYFFVDQPHQRRDGLQPAARTHWRIQPPHRADSAGRKIHRPSTDYLAAAEKPGTGSESAGTRRRVPHVWPGVYRAIWSECTGAC